MNILVTGSSGLIGSEAVQHHYARGHTMFGIHNNMLREQRDTTWHLDRLRETACDIVHLEASRQFCPEAVFIFMSTNKVYGDASNVLPLADLETRYDCTPPNDHADISQECRIDRCLHSLFGASKAAADLVTQEYGRYFGMKVSVQCGVCLTGPSHAGAEERMQTGVR